MTFRLLLAVTSLSCVTSFPAFEHLIPNGDSVPFPCKQNQTWPGVGHLHDAGAGSRNQFGIDFSLAGYKWTKELCQKDSDGDGRTNGEELGDPDCEWKENDIPKIRDNISHPGICDPWDSPACKQKPVPGGLYASQLEWLDKFCPRDEFVCPALNEPEIRNVSLKIASDFRVPNNATASTCTVVDVTTLGVPGDQEVQLMAVTSLKDTNKFVHHLILMRCDEDVAPRSEPFHCGMTPEPICPNILSELTGDLKGECFHPKAAASIGGSNKRILAVQVHWKGNNQTGDFSDSVGLVLHFRPKQ